MDDFTRRIARDQFALGHMQVGAVALPEIFPVLEGQMVPIEDISKMVHEGKLDATVAEEIERKYEQFRQEFTVVYRKTLTLSRELASELSYLEQEAASVLVDGVIEELKEKYPGSSVAEYLEEVRHHLLDNLNPFKEREGEGEQEEESPEGSAKMPGAPERDPFRVYGVNVILAHNHEETSPVIFETTPTYVNLFGTIQRAYDARGGWSSDFMDLRGGSLLRADGGFLIMYALEALSETGVWRALKRTLNHNRLEIQPQEIFYPFGGSALKPEAVDINVKVILIGDRQLYELLYEYEEDFRKIFKVRVEFDEEMAMSDGVIAEYAGRLRALSEKENLFPFDRGAFEREEVLFLRERAQPPGILGNDAVAHSHLFVELHAHFKNLPKVLFIFVEQLVELAVADEDDLDIDVDGFRLERASAEGVKNFLRLNLQPVVIQRALQGAPHAGFRQSLQRVHDQETAIGAKQRTTPQVHEIAAPAAARIIGALNGAKKRSEERRVGKECRSRWSPYH